MFNIKKISEKEISVENKIFDYDNLIEFITALHGTTEYPYDNWKDTKDNLMVLIDINVILCFKYKSFKHIHYYDFLVELLKAIR